MNKICEQYIGYSCNESNRYKAASGGICTSVIKYLLEVKKYDSALSFIFNINKCIYEPIIINNFSDYNICGSIYQDIDLYSFLKDNINKLGHSIVLTCLPCQIRGLKLLLNKYSIDSFIISLVCSGQMEVEGSYFYYKYLKIDKKDIIDIRYRGNGWPGGILIKLKDGSEVFRKNWSYPWTLIHSSYLFQPKRCFYCMHVVNCESDLTLADPWLDEYIRNDKLGNTLFSVNSKVGNEIVKQLILRGNIHVKQSAISDFMKSQSPTYKKRRENPPQKAKIKRIVSICKNKKYKSVVTKSKYLMILHDKIINKLLNK
jgi:coenzyme F420 hydrogenase subunit beta